MQLKRTTSQTLKGSKFERKTKSLFKPKFGNKGHICVVVAIAVLAAKGPKEAGVRRDVATLISIIMCHNKDI